MLRTVKVSVKVPAVKAHPIAEEIMLAGVLVVAAGLLQVSLVLKPLPVIVTTVPTGPPPGQSVMVGVDVVDVVQDCTTVPL